MSRRRNRKNDRWSMHYNDWMDNGTYHDYEEDELSEREAEQNEAQETEQFFFRKKLRRYDYKNTGRFDQFNDEFDASYDMHHQEYGGRDTVKEDESPGSTPPQDEYEDEDPYKIPQA